MFWFIEPLNAVKASSGDDYEIAEGVNEEVLETGLDCSCPDECDETLYYEQITQVIKHCNVH